MSSGGPGFGTTRNDVTPVEQRLVRLLHGPPEADVRPDLGEEDDLVLERLAGIDNRRKRVVLDDDESRSA